MQATLPADHLAFLPKQPRGLVMGPLLPWAGSRARFSFVSAPDTPLVEQLGCRNLQDAPPSEQTCAQIPPPSAVRAQRRLNASGV